MQGCKHSSYAAGCGMKNVESACDLSTFYVLSTLFCSTFYDASESDLQLAGRSNRIHYPGKLEYSTCKSSHPVTLMVMGVSKHLKISGPGSSRSRLPCFQHPSSPCEFCGKEWSLRDGSSNYEMRIIIFSSVSNAYVGVVLTYLPVYML